MWGKTARLLTGVFLGYLYIKWIPIHSPFHLSEFFIGLIVDPLKFFAASIAFTIGFIITGIHIKEGIYETRQILKGSKRISFSTFISYAVLFNFCFLFQIGAIQAIVFFCFALMYVMISICF